MQEFYRDAGIVALYFISCVWAVAVALQELWLWRRRRAPLLRVFFHEGGEAEPAVPSGLLTRMCAPPSRPLSAGTTTLSWTAGEAAVRKHALAP